MNKENQISFKLKKCNLTKEETREDERKNKFKLQTQLILGPHTTNPQVKGQTAIKCNLNYIIIY
jgi:hypothetical protein